MKCFIPTFEASREGQQYVLVISVRVRADLSLNLANFNINGFFSTDVHQNDQNVLLFVLKRPIFGYITLHGLIYQETLKKILVVLCDFSLYTRKGAKASA